MALTKKEQARKIFLIGELVKMSKDGWQHYRRDDWHPLEQELNKLIKKQG